VTLDEDAVAFARDELAALLATRAQDAQRNATSTPTRREPSDGRPDDSTLDALFARLAIRD
jgi:hypothetical protein